MASRLTFMQYMKVWRREGRNIEKRDMLGVLVRLYRSTCMVSTYASILAVKDGTGRRDSL